MVKQFFKKQASTMFRRMKKAKETFQTAAKKAGQSELLKGKKLMMLAALPIIGSQVFKNDPKKAQLCATVFGLASDVLTTISPGQGAAYLMMGKILSPADSPLRKEAETRLEKMKGVKPDFSGWKKTRTHAAQPGM